VVKRAAVLAIFMLAVAAFATGCGQNSAYVNPDEPDKLGGTGIDSQDVRTVAQQMSRDILKSSAIMQSTQKPVIALLPTKNETRFRVDTDIITLQMRDGLNQFAGDRMTFVERSLMNDINAERAAKRAGETTASTQKQVLGADYYLTGTLKSISKSAGDKRSDYIYYSFELVDAENSAVVWTGGYDVKKVGERGVLYR
jgi:penicillin-binding protein activator